MSEPHKCDDTSIAPILNTSQSVPTEPHGENDRSDKKKQKRQQETENDADAAPEKFQPFDLKLLTFKPIGTEQEVSVWYADPSVFHAYVSQFASGFRKVNINIWPLAERLAFVNRIWAFCQSNGKDFPFAVRQQVVPDVNTQDVPDVNVQEDKPASQVG